MTFINTIEYSIRASTLPDNKVLQVDISFFLSTLFKKEEIMPEKEIITGKKLTLQALKDRGVKYIFGYTGGAIMPVFDEMEKKAFHLFMPRHEQGATFMAQGLSRASLSKTTRRSGSAWRLPGRGP